VRPAPVDGPDGENGDGGDGDVDEGVVGKSDMEKDEDEDDELKWGDDEEELEDWKGEGREGEVG
jgi:hypothetical protein